MRELFVAALGMAITAASAPFDSTSARAAPTDASLTDLSLEDLLKVEVSLASRKKEALSDVAGAVFVVTNEDIRRSGVTTVADALRVVPGLQVGKIDANRWVVTARGFSGEFVNKLLVLVDGRTVYSPLYSGVYWDVQDLFLEDVDRIEVMRGPSAALWGANAVNGVINVVTKAASRTPGALVTAGGGTEERAFAGARYGWSTEGGAAWRVYAKYFDRDAGSDPNGGQGHDDWNSGRAGFRGDWTAAGHNRFVVSGDVYRGKAGAEFEEPTLAPNLETLSYTKKLDGYTRYSGGNLLGRWTWASSSGSELSVQAYYDRTYRDDPYLIAETRDTADLDVQHRFSLADWNEVVWGFGYRGTRARTEAGQTSSLDPSSRRDNLWSAFVQDHVTFLPNALRGIVACKFEKNDYTGFEAQPTARLIWTPTSRQALWASVSRAVRTPSEGETDGISQLSTIPAGAVGNPLPVSVQMSGSSNFESEKVVAFEAGYRIAPVSSLSFDLSTFYNRYKDLRTTVLGAPVLADDYSHLVQSFSFENRMGGRGYGAELAADWQAAAWWRLLAAYSYLYLRLDSDGRGFADETTPIEGGSPRHQVSLRSQTDLPWGLQADLWLRYVSKLWATEEPSEVRSYATLDVRLGWRPTRDLEFSVVGQNLFAPSHFEASREIGRPTGVVATRVEPGCYGKVAWSF